MAVAPRSPSATVTQAASSTTWVVTLPAYQAGDFVVIALGNNVGSTAGTPTATGWTVYKMDESSALKGTLAYKLMTGSEGTTVTFTWSGATLGVALATAFTGVDATTPVDIAPLGQAEASSTAIAAHVTPSRTTVTAGASLLSVFVTDVAATWTSTDTELGDAQSGQTGVNACSTAFYYSAPVAVGSYTRTGTASATSVKAVSILAGLRAGAVAPTALPLPDLHMAPRRP